jgi:hypothetical protein
MRVGGQSHVPAALPPGKTRYLLYRRLGWPQGRSGQVLLISTPPGFDAWTVKPVASRYTDWAIAAPKDRSMKQFSSTFEENGSTDVSVGNFGIIHEKNFF